MRGFLDRLEREQNDRAWLAWHSGVVARIKRVPPLKGLMVKPRVRAPKKQSVAQIKGNLDALVARTGG